MLDLIKKISKILIILLTIPALLYAQCVLIGMAFILSILCFPIILYTSIINKSSFVNMYKYILIEIPTVLIGAIKK